MADIDTAYRTCESAPTEANPTRTRPAFEGETPLGPKRRRCHRGQASVKLLQKRATGELLCGKARVQANLVTTQQKLFLFENRSSSAASWALCPYRFCRKSSRDWIHRLMIARSIVSGIIFRRHLLSAPQGGRPPLHRVNTSEIQTRTSPQKFVRSPCTDHYHYYCIVLLSLITDSPGHLVTF